MKVDHINRYVSNVDKFIEFYSKMLDYKLIGKGKKQNGNFYAILAGSGHELFISEKDAFEAVQENMRHIGYSVDNIESTLEKLIERGYPIEELKIIHKAFSRQIYIKDPDGMEIDLIQWTDKEGFYENLRIE